MSYNLNQLCCEHLSPCLVRGLGRARTLHRDERGTISILSVIVLLLLTMVLGMILNVGEQIDDKIKMQNSVDAATYSSGVVLARGLNTIAFTNHLLSETFALTAYFREGRDRYAESLVPEILDTWKTVGQQMAMSEFKLIRDIRPAIDPKIQMEREIVKAFGDMTAVKARLLIPALEMILGAPEGIGLSADQQRANADSHLIPVFQRAVVLAIADSSRLMVTEIARRNMPGSNTRNTQCVIWSLQTNPQSVINDSNPLERLLPALDPANEGPDVQYLSSGEIFLYQKMARKRRDGLASHYLREWIDDDNFDLGPFERNTLNQGGRVSAKMSQFINLYRGFTCAKLNHLLTEQYPQTNLPHVLRQPLSRQDRAMYTSRSVVTDGQIQTTGQFTGSLLTQQQYLDYDFTFMGAVYRPQRKPVMPGMYRVPIKGDAFSFARVMVYLPRARYTTTGGCPRFYGLRIDGFSGETGCDTPSTDAWPEEWTLFSQNWAAKMIPASSEAVLTLLQTNPGEKAPGVTLPNLNGIQMQDFRAINFH